MGTLSEKDLPGLWRDADRASLSGQRWTLRYARGRLYGSVGASMGGVLSLRTSRVDVAAAIVAAGFLVALISEVLSLIHRPERVWYSGRALAESAKTLAWRYAVAANPFPPGMSTKDAQSLLRQRLEQAIRATSSDITITSVGVALTEGMNDLRRAPFADRRTAYIADRTLKQYEWYVDQAKRNNRCALVWHSALVVAEIVALTLALLRVFGPWDINLAGVLATVIGAGAAWVAIKQYSRLASMYSMAAGELALQVEGLHCIDLSAWPSAVADAEDAISREHTIWLAARTGALPLKSSGAGNVVTA